MSCSVPTFHWTDLGLLRSTNHPIHPFPVYRSSAIHHSNTLFATTLPVVLMVTHERLAQGSPLDPYQTLHALHRSAPLAPPCLCNMEKSR